MIHIIPVPLGLTANAATAKINEAIEKAKAAGVGADAVSDVSHHVVVAVNGLSSEDEQRLVREFVRPALG